MLGRNTAPHITIYDTSDWSIIANPSYVPLSDLKVLEFNADGSKLHCGIQGAPYFFTYNVSDWTVDTAPAELPIQLVYAMKLSPDGSKMAVLFSTSVNHPIVYETTTWTRLTVPVIDLNPVYSTTGNWYDVVWKDNDNFITGALGAPGLRYYDLENQTVTYEYMVFNAVSLAIYKEQNYEVVGSISEALAMANWKATAYDIGTGSIQGEVLFTGTDFTLSVPSENAVNVTIEAQQGSVWETIKLYSLDDLVFPTEPDVTPYYYECTTAGTSGGTEPVWPITISGTVTDGSVEWTRVEKLINPETHGPIMPTVVT